VLIVGFSLAWEARQSGSFERTTRHLEKGLSPPGEAISGENSPFIQQSVSECEGDFATGNPWNGVGSIETCRDAKPGVIQIDPFGGDGEHYAVTRVVSERLNSQTTLAGLGRISAAG
jgi:hypothetical protein